MQLEQISKPMLREVMSQLSPVDLFTGIGAASRGMREVAKSLVLLDSGYTERVLGRLPLKPQALPSLVPFVIAAHVTKPKIFKFGVHYTDGGFYQGSRKYWMQNVFEYTGSDYTTDGVTENVTVAGTFLGSYIDYQFHDRLHEDLCALLDSFMSWPIPEKFKKNILPLDTFLNDTLPRTGESFPREEYNEWAREEGSLHTVNVKYSYPLTYTSRQQAASEYALVTHVGVARPAYFTTPVRTVLVCSALLRRPPDLSRYYNLSSLEALLARTGLPPIAVKAELSDFTYVEFEATEGPLVWVQFTAYQCSQIEIALKTRRVMRFAELLLVDIEDRTEEFYSSGKSIDITYVVFAGKSLPSELKEMLDVLEDLKEEVQIQEDSIEE